MAIPVIQSRSEQKQGANTTSSTITAPSGIADGDVLIICMATDGDAGTITWPSGFTQIDAVLGDIGACTGAGAYKIASSESGNYAVSWVNSQEAIFQMYRVDGADSGNEIQDPNENANPVNSTTPTITPIASTDQDDCLVFVIHGVDQDDITVDGGGDADYTTEDVDSSSAGFGVCSIGVQTKGVATAAVPPACTLTLTASEQAAMFWFAVRGAAAAVAGNPWNYYAQQ